MEKGTKVWSRDKKEIGEATGTSKVCSLEGCTGRRYGVRWKNGKITWPCGKGMDSYKEGYIIL